MDVSLILYAEHEYNASTFTARVVVSTLVRPALGHHRRHRRAQGPAARRRQRSRDGSARGSRHGRAGRGLDSRRTGQEATHHGLRPSRLQDRRPAGRLPADAVPANWPTETGNQDMEAMADMIETHRAQRKEAAAEPRLAQRPALPLHGPGRRSVHAAVRAQPRRRLELPTSSSSSTTTA